MQHKPLQATASFEKTLANDYLTLLLAIVGPLILGMGLFADIFGFLPGKRWRAPVDVDPDSAGKVLIAGSVVTVIFWILMAIRYYRVAKIVETGPRAQARVVNLFLEKRRDRGWVEFEYMAFRQQCRASMGIRKNEFTAALRKGSLIEVAFDPDKPQRAFIVALFCDAYMPPQESPGIFGPQ